MARPIVTKADVNATSTFSPGGTALNMASEMGALGIARLLLARGADVEIAIEESGHTPLYTAVASKDYKDEMVLLLIDAAADVNCFSIRWKATPLYEACYRKNVGAVQMLLEAKANVNFEMP